MFIKKHLSLTKAFWFWTTVSAILFFCFIVIAFNKPTDIDIRVMNLIVNFRDIEDANIFLFFTYLGNAEIVGTLGLVITCALWLLHKRRPALFVFAGVAIAYFASGITKLLTHRSRPGAAYSLIQEGGFSFPSGHATISVVFYGIIALLLYTILKRWWQKTAIILFFFFVVLLIGFSRIYLGVHWFSDVLAGWLLGLSVLIFLIAIFKSIRVSKEGELKNISIVRTDQIGLLIAVLLIDGLFISNYYYRHPLQTPPGISSQPLVFVLNSSDLLKTIEDGAFPKFSETITGKNMSPVSFIVVGSLDTLTNAFKNAGWYESNRKVGTVFKLAFTALLNRPDPTAFITPAFLNGAPDSIAFEKPTGSNTVRQRHHTRFWATNFMFRGTPIWVATASFDEGLRYLIAHKINPDIDAERDYIKSDLEKTGSTASIQEIQLVKPMSGKNQIGDKFFTDGKAYVIFLK